MSFDAGSIIATADLDRDPFNRGLDLAKADGEAFAERTFRAQLDLDDRQASEKRQQENAALDDYAHKTATATLNVDTKDSAAKISAEDAAVDEFGRKRETATLNVDSSGADRGLKDFKAAAADASGPGGAGLLLTSIAALGPALVPISGVLVAGVAGLLPVLASAGAGFGAFALAAAGDLGEVKYVAESTLASFQKLAAAAVMPVINGSLSLMIPLFSDLMPLVDGTATELLKLEGAAQQAFTAPFWRGFISFLGAEAGPAINSLMSLVGGFVKAFAGVAMAMGPIISDIEGGISAFAAHIATWGQNLSTNQGFIHFIDFVKQEAPVVGQFLSNLGKDFTDLITAAAPVGAVVLGILTQLTGFLDVLMKIDGPLTSVGLAVLGAALTFAKLAPVVQGAAAAITRFYIATAATEGTAAVGGLAGSLGGIVAALGGLGPAALIGGAALVGIYAITSALAGSTNSVTVDVENATAAAKGYFASVLNEAGSTLPQLQAKLGDLRTPLKAVQAIPVSDQNQATAGELSVLQDAIAKTSGQIRTYNDNLYQVQTATGLTRQQIIAMAASINVDLNTALRPDQVRQFTAALQQQEAQSGLTAAALRSMAASSGVSMAQVAADMGAATTATKSSWASLGNAVSNFASATLPPTGAAIAAFYTQQATEGAQFSANIQKAIAAGYDPQLIEKILQAGPAQASQLLQGLVNAQGTGLNSLISSAMSAMSREGIEAVQEARLTQEAISASSSAMTAQLGSALAISQALTATNVLGSVRALIAGMSGGLPEFLGIVGEYKIALPKGLLDELAPTTSAANAQSSAVVAAFAAGVGPVSVSGGTMALALPNALNAHTGESAAAAQNLVAAALAPLSQIGPGFAAAGHQAGAGLSQGMLSAASAVGNAAAALITNAVASAKSAAQIKSPSAVFANEVGEPSGLGIAVGMASPAVMAAIGAAGGTLVKHALSASTLPAGPTAPRGGYSVSSSLAALGSSSNTVDARTSLSISVAGNADQSTVAQIEEVATRVMASHVRNLTQLMRAR